MVCNSNHIAYMGTGKNTYSFDVSTQEMRNQIIDSIHQKIESYDEEISKYDYEIEELQKELQALLKEDDITLENIIAYKNSYNNIEQVEATLLRLDNKIIELKNKLENGIAEIEDAKKQQDAFLTNVIICMNQVREAIDVEGTNAYQDLFTKRGTVASGSEETVFYVSKLIAIAQQTNHVCPIIIDSFRAEDLSTDKEERVIKLLQGLSKQCILTTTLKAEENGKYDNVEKINGIDYSNHLSNKLLTSQYVSGFKKMLSEFHMLI